MKEADVVGVMRARVSGMIPAMFSQVWRSTNQALADATLTAISFDTVIRDDPACWAVASPTRLTIKLAGAYIITGQCSFNTSATGRRVVGILLNGATYINYQTTNTNSVAPTHVTTTTIKYLAVGDYLEMIGYQNNGGNLNVLTSNNSPMFGIAWMGG
jgi:hypothetical protein